MREPSTGAEWSEALDAAVFSVGLAAAEAYGLVEGPDVNFARCEDLIAAGRAAGYPIPTLDQVLERAAHRQLPEEASPPGPSTSLPEADRTPPFRRAR